MNSKTVIGIVLIVIGIFALGYQGITYTTHKKVVDIGPIEATKKEDKTIPLPPIVGILALAGGVVVLAADRRAS
jgi:drug/metabolite transporter (DMT)-like permease